MVTCLSKLAVEDKEAMEQPRENDSLASDLQEIEHILGKTRRGFLRPYWLEGFMWYLVALGAWLLFVLFCAAVLPHMTVAKLAILLPGGIILWTVCAILLALFSWLNRPSLLRMAKILEHHEQTLRNDVVASLDFAKSILSDAFEQGASEGLARLHITNTVEKLRQSDAQGHLVQALPEPHVTPVIFALCS